MNAALTPEQYERAKEIFLDLCDSPDEEHAEKVAERAAGDVVVLECAMRMLGHDRATQSAEDEEKVRRGLERLLQTAPGEDAALQYVIPEMIGQYRIVGRVGSGGMGDVFEGKQENPHRSVAIKVMRSGLASPTLLRRFRREVEFLGRLSHPGIAQVYEAGVTQIGAAQVPYYAMEFVNGPPLTRFVSEQQLDTQQILRLFALICDTVQYAHQQGVIHRDLKPGNILVQDAPATRAPEAGATTGDTTLGGIGARPRILDFGIARAVDAGLPTGGAQGSIATEAGQVIGTIPYMSPEQIDGRPGDVDTRTDVYALGVILFELLTGKLPHNTDGASLIEAARLKSQTAALRLSGIRREYRGDLETIVEKALEPDKARRYGAASELAADIRRFLNDEVIAAKPATRLYKMRKFAKRNKALVSAAALALLALIAGVVATTLEARRAIRERDVAVHKTEVAESVSTVLLQAITVATPKGSVGKEPRLLDAIERIESQANDEAHATTPEAQAVVLNITGIVWRERGDYERAEKNFTRALEIRKQVLSPLDPNLADSFNNMGLLRKKQERYIEAAEFYQQAVDIQRKSTFQDDSRLARNIYNLASAYISAGRFEKAKPLLEESLQRHYKLLGQKNEIIAYHLSALGRIALAENRPEEALDQAQKALNMQRECVGPAHPSIAVALCDYADALMRGGRAQEAIAAMMEGDAMAHQVFAVSPPHPTLKQIRLRLVKLLRSSGREEEARALETDLAAVPSFAPKNDADKDQ